MLFGNPEEREFDRIRDNGKASREGRYLRETFRGRGAKFRLDTDEVSWKGERDPNRIQPNASNSYCILDRMAWGWLLEVEMLRSTS